MLTVGSSPGEMSLDGSGLHDNCPFTGAAAAAAVSAVVANRLSCPCTDTCCTRRLAPLVQAAPHAAASTAPRCRPPPQPSKRSRRLRAWLGAMCWPGPTPLSSLWPSCCRAGCPAAWAAAAASVQAAAALPQQRRRPRRGLSRPRRRRARRRCTQPAWPPPLAWPTAPLKGWTWGPRARRCLRCGTPRACWLAGWVPRPRLLAGRWRCCRLQFGGVGCPHLAHPPSSPVLAPPCPSHPPARRPV